MNQSKKIVEHPVKPEGEAGAPLFDDRVHISDSVTGKIIRYQPYAWHVFGDDKKSLYERPIGSGNMWDARGKPIGRWKTEANGSWVKFDDTHIATKPHAVNEKELIQQENESLRAELEALRAEKEEKTPLATPKVASKKA